MTLDFGFPAPDSTLSETTVQRPSALPTPGGQGLPEDLLREASRRLAILCLISACIWAVNLALLNFVYAVPGTIPTDRVVSYWKWRPVYDLVGTMNIAVSLGLLWYTRRGKRSARSLLDLALVYEVFIALSVALLDYAEPGPTEGVSWIAVIILLFASITPSTPKKTLLAAFAAASMGPVAAEIWRELGARPRGLDKRSSCPSRTISAPAWQASSPTSYIGWAARSGRPGRWGVMSWEIGSPAAGWARSGERRTAFWPGRPRSS